MTGKQRSRREWGSIVKRGSRYAVRYSDAEGKRRWRAGGKTLREAEATLRALRVEITQERHGVSARPLTLAAWWDAEYLDVLASRLKTSGLRTACVHVQRLSDWLVTERGDPYLRDVTRRDAEGFVAALIAEGLKPSYVRRLVSTIRRAWVDAVVRGLSGSNPWEKLKIASPAPTRVPWITAAQLAAIYAAVAESARPHITLIGETGLRAGEAQALRRRDVDLEADHPRLTVRDGKTAAARRTVPLTRRAVAVLREELAGGGDGDDLVLAVRSQQWMRKALRAACAATSTERLKVHSLRHVYASHLVQAGVPPSTVARLLGHADGGALVLRLYGRWMPHDAETRAVAGLEAVRALADAAPPSSGA